MKYDLLHIAIPAHINRDNLSDYTASVLGEFSTSRTVEPWQEYLKGSPEKFPGLEILREHGYHLPEDGLTWTHVVDAFNRHYLPNLEEGRLYLDNDGRAYRYATHNPNGRIQHWGIGGQWSLYWLVTWNANPDDLIGFDPEARRATGGRVGQLNIDGMRQMARTATEETAKDQAPDLAQHATGFNGTFAYSQHAHDTAVVPAAFVDLESNFHIPATTPPGHERFYRYWVNQYLNDLDPEAWLLAVDAELV